jgi:hypothetical protein
MRYVIERQYLLPIYQHLIIEAGSAEEACRKAIEHDDWEDAKEDGDGARETTITALRPVPDGQEPDNLGDFLYGDKPEEATRAVPAAFAENPIPPLGKRCKDALVIVNPGACNPSGIALAIAEACREIREQEPSRTAQDDPAVRLMVYQLATVCKVADYALERYIADEAACKARLDELGLKPYGAG